MFVRFFVLTIIFFKCPKFNFQRYTDFKKIKKETSTIKMSKSAILSLSKNIFCGTVNKSDIINRIKLK